MADNDSYQYDANNHEFDGVSKDDDYDDINCADREDDWDCRVLTPQLMGLDMNPYQKPHLDTIVVSYLS